MSDILNKPTVEPAYADNGEFSHWRLIDPETGKLLWSEFPEEDKILYVASSREEQLDTAKVYECYFDGSCEPVNPGGSMGFGVLIICDGKEIERTNHLPAKATNTNNVAEYIAFLLLMKNLQGITDCRINIYGDSNMVVNQMNGNWKIKDGAYVSFALECKSILQKLKEKNEVKISWIPREQNTKADKLSKAHLK